MKYNIPAIEEYDKLLPVVRELYQHISALSWQMLLPFFLLSVAFGYSSDLGIAGSILVRLKRLVLAAILLSCFPMIAEFCQILGVEIAKSIDNMNGIDQILDAARKRAEAYTFDLQGLLNLKADFIIGPFVLLSFLILVIARFFLLAFQHFYWFLLVTLGPFLILGVLFESSSAITKGLFKNMLKVSSWPIIWSTLSAFLKALPFASAYNGIDEVVTVITLNLIVAIALLFSPFIVSQLCEGVDLSIGETVKRGALRAVSAVAPKTTVFTKAAERASGAANRMKTGGVRQSPFKNRSLERGTKK